ncbi:hypothetical protein [Pseudorhizobium flavum]|uniref:hypothetical protein n=1 Tax=Pseudorhizobium flavum TaxID=1335061 RepID=UPI0024916E65|nr:hypothetical protein [Pseudorhizobium flavum]
MNEEEAEHQATIQGYEIAIGVFLNAPLRREEYRERFRDMEEAARQRNMHSATIAVLRDLQKRLSE